jgi:hypothetical protein
MREKIIDENPKSEDMMICKSLLRDVTNVDKMRRKSAHKEAVEKTASPNFCTKELKKSLEGKENDEVIFFFFSKLSLNLDRCLRSMRCSSVS